jgi:hypothetical protein
MWFQPNGAICPSSASLTAPHSRSSFTARSRYTVQSAGDTPTERWIAKPFESGQGSLQSTVFPPRGHAVLARVGCEFAQDQRGRHRPPLDGGRETHDLIELLFHEEALRRICRVGIVLHPLGKGLPESAGAAQKRARNRPFAL